MLTEHNFEDEQGNEIPLLDTTYEIVRTYVDPVYLTTNPKDGYVSLVFTYVVRLREE